jgi:hypothetical protein
MSEAAMKEASLDRRPRYVQNETEAIGERRCVMRGDNSASKTALFCPLARPTTQKMHVQQGSGLYGWLCCKNF